MTSEEIQSLNQRIHSEVFGLRILSQEEMRADFEARKFTPTTSYILTTLDADCIRFGVRPHPIVGGEPSFEQILPDYASDVREADRVEAEIERRGLGAEYAKQLVFILWPGRFRNPVYRESLSFEMPWEMQFTLLRASPAHKSQAALEAVSSEQQQKEER